jgi:hypothetical protein
VAAMPTAKRELPAVLIYSVAITVGVLAALAAQIWFASRGYNPVSIWHGLFSARSLQLQTAGPWWAMAGLAFIASGTVAAVLSRCPLPWRHRGARWTLGILLVFGLAHIGHAVAGPSSVIHAGAQVAVSIVGLLVAAALGMVGALLVRR